MQGSAKRNLFMFKKLCGNDALQNIVLGTTMWEQVSEDMGSQRELELVQTPEFWGYMHEKGSQIVRHMNDRKSALKIIELFMPKQAVVLELQDEMVKHEKGLHETAAGQEVEAALVIERAKFEREIAQTKKDMEFALELKDKEVTDMLQQNFEEMSLKMSALNQQSEHLKVSMEKLHQEKLAALEAQLEEQRSEGATLRKSIQRLSDDKQAALAAMEEKLAAQKKKGELQQTEIKSLRLNPTIRVQANRSWYRFDRVGEVTLTAWGKYWYRGGPVNHQQ
jgi:hypothetical protein